MLVSNDVPVSLLKSVVKSGKWEKGSFCLRLVSELCKISLSSMQEWADV